MEDQVKYNSKGGRPVVKKELSQKHHFVNVSFNKVEWDIFLKDHGKTDLTYVGYARNKILNNTKLLTSAEKDYRKFYVELNKIGSNINQIAKHLNSEGSEFVEGDTKETFDNMVKLFLEIQRDR